ncbi:DUF305 domain-containing protein [Achromobacter xylosoxidans]
MSAIYAPWRRRACACMLVLLAGAGGPAWAQATAPDDETAFLAENDASMDRMMKAMAPHPSGDVDQDFVAMMVPHHQGAIDMAMAELRYGKNEQLRRIAQEIIVEQQQEIAAMHLALGHPLPAPRPAPDQPADLRPASAPVPSHHGASHAK